MLKGSETVSQNQIYEINRNKQAILLFIREGFAVLFQTPAKCFG